MTIRPKPLTEREKARLEKYNAERKWYKDTGSVLWEMAIRFGIPNDLLVHPDEGMREVATRLKKDIEFVRSKKENKDV